MAEQNIENFNELDPEQRAAIAQAIQQQQQQMYQQNQDQGDDEDEDGEEDELEYEGIEGMEQQIEDDEGMDDVQQQMMQR